MSKQLLITVGTTKFENLIKSIDEDKFYEMAIKNKFTKIIIQKGYGSYIPINYKKFTDKIDIQVAELLPNFENIINSSEIIITHAGAGIILESLKHNKKIIACVNDTLMGNHQLELASSLHNDNYVYYCENLKKITECTNKLSNNEITLKEYPSFNYDIIPNIIYSMLGI